MTQRSGCLYFGSSRCGAFFFIGTIIALGVAALISLILSVRGLWSLRRTTPD